MSYNNLFVNEDGAGPAARAVRAYLSAYDGIESSWSSEQRRYQAEPSIDRWSNGREQGYVVRLVNFKQINFKQINLIFTENRNSDDLICYEVVSPVLINPLTVADMVPGDFKWIHRENHDGARSMARFIRDRLEAFWIAPRELESPAATHA